MSEDCHQVSDVLPTRRIAGWICVPSWTSIEHWINAVMISSVSRASGYGMGGSSIVYLVGGAKVTASILPEEILELISEAVVAPGKGIEPPTDTG